MSTLTAEGLRRLWLTARFGFQEDIFKGRCYTLGDYGIIASARDIRTIRNLGGV